MVTTVNLPDELHAALKRVADDEHRSMNATILVAVERYVADRSHRSRVRELATDVARRHAELLDRLGK
ncbi:Arc family DNA-binding protein [Phytohabitans sp. ZYX-F-186]|uniref:Arc family DNA-binding protein n=1 Tax=Phytohabitans maris TaxID=3071409 RepID=A0ABU0ZP25_9ACTN|nr:Arc family DNA-binding protein [Phytohabitans sp. ZYX-F-186]MDQ7908708.1 Arc family DNA-binding protein [Phytohabitans sp. ZYX-F-186]